MPVVSNTSPVLNLAIIGQLDLLRRQFGEVWIPSVVLQPRRNIIGDFQGDLPHFCISGCSFWSRPRPQW